MDLQDDPANQPQPPIQGFNDNDDWARDLDAELNAPFIGGDHQTQLWQSNHYMEGNGQQQPSGPGSARGESGFISGSTTQPPSMTGHEDDTEGFANAGGHISGPGSITGSSLYDLDSMTHSEVSSVHSSQYCSEPDDFIPQLTNALTDDDQYVVDQCLINVDKFSRKENFLRAIIRSQPLVSALVNALNNASAALVAITKPPSTPEEQETFNQCSERAKSASNIMRNMSNSSDGRRVIVLGGGVPGLAKLIRCPVDRVMFIAIATIHNLLLTQEEDIRDGAKNGIREAEGVQAMVRLLMRENERKLMAIVTDCLRILAVQHSATKKAILECNGPQVLVRIMQNQNYKNLIMMTSRLLKVLSVCPNNKPAIIRAGGIDALAKHLINPSNQIKSHCIWALRNLSDAATVINDIKSLVSSLVELLKHSDQHIVICSAGILFNLTCNNEPNKLTVCQAGGIQGLVGVIQKFGNNKDLLEPAVCALRHLTNNHNKADVAQNLLCLELDALPVMMHMLTQHMKVTPIPHWPSVKAMLGLLKNLAQRPQNHVILREKGCVANVRDLLKFLVDALLSRQLPSNSVEGTRPEEVIEFATNCLLSMAKDTTCPQEANNGQIGCKAVLTEPRLIQTLGKMLSNRAERLQILTTSVLHELSNVQTGAFAIQKEGVADAVRMLTNAKNEKIASHANAVIFNVQNLNPGDFGRLQGLLQQQLQQVSMQQQSQQQNGPPPPQMQAQQLQPPQQQQPPYQQQPGGPPQQFPPSHFNQMGQPGFNNGPPPQGGGNGMYSSHHQQPQAPNFNSPGFGGPPQQGPPQGFRGGPPPPPQQPMGFPQDGGAMGGPDPHNGQQPPQQQQGQLQSGNNSFFGLEDDFMDMAGVLSPPDYNGGQGQQQPGNNGQSYFGS